MAEPLTGELRAALAALVDCLELRSDGRTVERVGTTAAALAAYRAARQALEGKEPEG